MCCERHSLEAAGTRVNQRVCRLLGCSRKRALMSGHRDSRVQAELTGSLALWDQFVNGLHPVPFFP